MSGTPGSWKYEPIGDVDGDAALDGIAGIDHFVMAGDTELACLPDEATARLIASAPDLLEAAMGVALSGATYSKELVRPMRTLITAIQKAQGNE